MGSTSARQAGLAIASIATAAALAACGASNKSSSVRTQPQSSPPEAAPVRTIAFRRFLDPDHHTGVIFTMRTDGTGERQVSHPSPGNVDSFDGPPAFTPDGATLVFDRTDAHGNGSLWRVGVDGTGERRLKTIQGFPGDGAPTVSPDGRRIAIARAYGKHKYGGLKTALYVLSIDGSNARPVAAFGYRADVTTAAWSPDGARIVFAVNRNDLTTERPNGSALFTVRPNGRALHRLTAWRQGTQYSAPDYSPDGRRLLFQVKPVGQDFGGDYYVSGADGSHPRRLRTFGANESPGSARWSPDGRWILFANSGTAGADDIFLMRSDGSQARSITSTPTWESAVTWVPGQP